MDRNKEEREQRVRVTDDRTEGDEEGLKGVGIDEQGLGTEGG